MLGVNFELNMKGESSLDSAVECGKRKGGGVGDKLYYNSTH